MCFDKIEARIDAVLTDRCKVNYKIVDKLKTLTQFSIVHFTCLRHDLNNAVVILMDHQMNVRDPRTNENEKHFK